MPAADQEVLSFLVDADVRQASRRVAGFQQDLTRRFKKVSQSVEGLGKVSDKVNKRQTKSVEALTEAYEEESKELDRLTRIMDSLGRKAGKASGAELKGIQKQIRGMKGIVAQQKAIAKEAQNAAKQAQNASKKALKAQQTAKKKGAKGGGLFGALFGDTDIGRKAKQYKETGKAYRTRGAKVGKVGGKMGGVAGGALKGVGKALGGIGKLVGVFSKFIPILSTVGSAVMAIIKLFLDADAHVKEFNKSILDVAGSSEFLGSTTKGVTGDFNKMKGVLNEIRSTAEEFWFNNDWGIMPEDHVKVLNVMNQEGVSLRMMGAEADRTGMKMGQYQKELMKVSVAYSRAFGLPMQEINTFQAEMMRDMGMSLEDTRLAFASMTRAARDSGIASNKFFSMIRGVSQDLSLYNLRIGSAVKLLGMLGKVMNPREAQKFMQFAMQGLKGMSQDDRMKLRMLAGGKGAGIVKKDLENKRKNLAHAIGEALGTTDEKSMEEIQAKVKAGKAGGLIETIKDASKKGALKGASIDLKIDETAAKKGVYGEAFAMENMGAGASLEMMQAALAGWGGGKTLLEGAGSLGMGKMAENLGIGTEQLRGMMKLEVAIRDEKKALIEKLKESDDYRKADSEKRAAMEKAIQDKGAQDILDAMPQEEQDALKDAAKSEMDLMKEQTKATDSIMNQITRLLDFIMNQVYGVLSSILDSFIALLRKLNIFGDEKSTVEKLRDLEADARQVQDKTMRDALMDVMQKTSGRSVEDRYAALARVYQKEDKARLGRETKAQYEKQLGLDKVLAQQTEEEKKAGEVGGLLGADVRGMAAEAGLKDEGAIKRLEELQGRVQGASFMGGTKTMAAFHEEMVKALEPFKKSAEDLGVISKAPGTGAPGTVFGEGMTLVDASGQPVDMKDLKLYSGPLPTDIAGGAPLPAGMLPSGLQVDLTAPPEEPAAGPPAAGTPDYAAMFMGPPGPEAGGPVDYTKLFTEGSDPEITMAGLSQETADNTIATADAIEAQTKNQKNDATVYVRFGTSFLNNQYKKVINEAVLEAMRLALFEYFMYSKLDPEEVAETLVANGLSGPEFAKALGEGAPTGQGAKELFGLEGSSDDDEGDGDGTNPPGTAAPGTTPKVKTKVKPKPAKTHQGGTHGVMVGTDKYGWAEFQLRGNEGLTSIGPGEGFGPAHARGRGGAGGAGGPVVVQFRGDAKRLLEVVADERIYANKKRERNH